MTIKFPRRKHLANYIGCHITGTIYSRAQIRQITFALQLKNYHKENVARIIFKHPQIWNVCIWKQIFCKTNFLGKGVNGILAK